MTWESIVLVAAVILDVIVFVLKISVMGLAAMGVIHSYAMLCNIYWKYTGRKPGFYLSLDAEDDDEDEEEIKTS